MRKGFSLVELSIVLVILGLLVGGILSGRSLIRAAELRGAANDYQNIVTAFNSYEEKYMAVPGDHDNAFAFWGTACAADAASCNGDGNGLVDSWTDEYATVWTREYIPVWTHMELAGIARFPAGDDWGRKASKMSNVIIYIFKDGVYYTPSRNRNAVAFTSYGTHSASWLEGAFSPIDAYNIDRKVDDGIPGTGNITSMNGQNDATASAQACLSGTAYDLTLTDIGCALQGWL